MQSFVWVIVEVPLFSVELTDYKINKAAGNNASWRTILLETIINAYHNCIKTEKLSIIESEYNFNPYSKSYTFM